MINHKLFDTAYIPSWIESLNSLQLMAQSESWCFRESLFERKNKTNPILERYIHTIFQNQVMDFQSAETQKEADTFLCVRGGYVCFHTGLMTHRYKSIYGFLEKNRRPGSQHEWFFKGFFDDTSPALRCVDKLPDKPFSYFRKEQWGFYPDWKIRVNVDHILDDAENLERIPEGVRYFPNLYILLQAGVELARRTAEFIPSIAVPQLYRGKIQYLLPISLHDPRKPDLAMTIMPMDGYYIGSTCLNLEMAYSNARLLARPTAPWLTALVE